VKKSPTEDIQEQRVGQSSLIISPGDSSAMRSRTDRRQSCRNRWRARAAIVIAFSECVIFSAVQGKMHPPIN